MISHLQLPDTIREYVPMTVQLRQSVEELETMAYSADNGSVRIGLAGFPAVVAMWNQTLGPFQEVSALYYQVQSSSLLAIVGMVRTTLVEIVSELAESVPMETLPTKTAVDAAVQIYVHGSHDTYKLRVDKNSGVIGQGSNFTQTQTNSLSDDLTRLIQEMRSALSKVEVDDEREDLEQAIDDFELEVSADQPDEKKVRRRAGVLRRLAGRTGSAVLTAAATEAGQLAVQAIGQAIQ
jgi:hypothetical protein